MAKKNIADLRLEHGTEFPYNNRAPIDWAERAALGVLADLCDRRGIKWALQEVDEDDLETTGIRNEMVTSLAEIIRRARSAERLPDSTVDKS